MRAVRGVPSRGGGNRERGKRGDSVRVHPALVGEPGCALRTCALGSLSARAGIGGPVRGGCPDGSSPGGGGTTPRRFPARRWEVIPAAGGGTQGPGRASCELGPPRRGGGKAGVHHAPRSSGSSPRGRGGPGEAQRPRGGGHPGRAGTEMAKSPFPERGVHPRAGGGTSNDAPARGAAFGPSPRGRGNPRPPARGSAKPGSIPARAGEPARHHHAPFRAEVHPRAGGGTGRAPQRPRWLGGPSQRGRGNLGHGTARGAVSGSIPARAGGTRLRKKLRCPGAGPSPRGRGNHHEVSQAPAQERSIPARAGEPTAGSRRGRDEGVHPRAGGGTPDKAASTLEKQGPSPRGRGNPERVRQRRAFLGSIPARAGEPGAPAGWPGQWGVHPRAGGGTSAMAPPGGRCQGPSPRGRGEPACARNCGVQARVHPRAGGGTITKCLKRLRKKGPSPRGRGNQRLDREGDVTKGSIPARAGEPRTRRPPPSKSKVHPRAGGGTDTADDGAPSAGGPSPRGRGNPEKVLVGHLGQRSIPARAGEPGHPASPPRPAWVHPRAGGGTVIMADIEPGGEGPSPRGRGNRALAPGRSRRQGSIPARAGEPHGQRWPGSSHGVHPRAGGGTGDQITQQGGGRGPSPRGRGNLAAPSAAANGGGSIPARAGEPSTSSSASSLMRVHPRAGGGTSIISTSSSASSGPSPRGR